MPTNYGPAGQVEAEEHRLLLILQNELLKQIQDVVVMVTTVM